MSEIKVPITVRMLNIMRNVAARNMSWFIKARSKSGPVVGRLKTTEMMVEPETKRGSAQPTVLTNGLSATRTGYLKSRRVCWIRM